MKAPRSSAKAGPIDEYMNKGSAGLRKRRAGGPGFNSQLSPLFAVGRWRKNGSGSGLLPKYTKPNTVTGSLRSQRADSVTFLVLVLFSFPVALDFVLRRLYKQRHKGSAFIPSEMRPFSLSLLITASLCLPSVLAWGAAGHEIVATIAQIHLHPTVFPTVCNILNFTSTNPDEPQCHLAPIAAWADQIRYRMRWSAPLHYVGALDDYPSQTCVFPGERGWAGRQGGNVLGAVRNVTNILEDWQESSDNAANEALKFLVHFLGDLHMPLHLTGRNRGGNGNKVRFDGRITNLHSLWDGLLIAKAIRQVPRNYSRPLPSRQIEFALRGTIYDSYVRRIMWEGILNKWADDVSDWVACPSTSQPTPPSTLWQHVLSTVSRFTHIRSVEDETDDHTLCPYHWAEPIHKLNCEIVWPKELDEPPYKDAPHLDDAHDHSCCDESLELTSEDYAANGPYLELDTPEYSGVITERMIVEKLLAQAGIRLAAVINWLFADFGDGSGQFQPFRVES
ncbi:Endonuclease 2 [Hypsizygus marmoreus]|uniref:Endonuclease 2 n=1 Tax=Hypsizygus marmoreus TaxID=39966 RepID=A0A369JBA6_HYPMA|nr:Endonuclease 2 [Hypsizygus marmoreus]